MSQTKAQLIDGKSAEIEFTGGSASAPAISFTGDTNTGIYSPGADQVAVATNGTGQLFISSLGNIGIGAASPSAWSYGGNIAMLGTGRYIASTSDDIRFASNVYTSDVERYAANGFATRYRMSDGTHQWATAVTGTANNAITYNESMRITAAGLVGIGSSTPGSYNAFADDLVIANGSGNPGITLAGSATGWGSIYFADGITGSEPYRGYIQYSHTNDRMTFATGGGLAAMHIDSSQRVGIGTTSPITTQGGLDVSSGGISLVIGADSNAQTRTNSAIKAARLATPHYTNAEEPFGLLFGISDSSTNELYIGGGTTAINAATDIRFHTAANNTTTSGSERARIDSSGRLLVGTSTSTSATVNGLVGKTQIASSENAALALHGHSSTALYGADIVFTRSRSATIGTNTIVQNGDEFGRIYFTGANGTGFDYGASIQAVVDGTPGVGDMPGRLVFSTTASGASSPTERTRITSGGRLLQFSSGGDAFVGVTGSGAGLVNTLLALNHSGTSTTTGTNCFYVATNGDVRNTNNSYGAISDIKLKENIVDANSQWDDIKSLQVRKYNFKPETNQQTHTQIGLVAQEVELVSPGLVSESPDLDEDGNDLGTVTKSVNYSVLYMKAVKALQEAMERIETLEAKVAALETP
jgi:hypothetical protein